jgi:hypothetical protein
MKKTFTLFITLFILSFVGKAQVKNEVAKSLSDGNASNLVVYFHDNVDLSILNKDDLYTKAECRVKLNQFFTQVKPSNFSILHEGKSNTGLEYVIGTLSTESGDYRVSFYLKDEGNGERVQQLMIDKE